jgi:hypothetical protein
VAPPGRDHRPFDPGLLACPGPPRSGVALIGPPVPPAREGAVQAPQEHLGADAVVPMGGVDDHPAEPSWRVHHDMPLAPAHLLAAVETPWPALLARLRRLDAR